MILSHRHGIIIPIIVYFSGSGSPDCPRLQRRNRMGAALSPGRVGSSTRHRGSLAVLWGGRDASVDASVSSAGRRGKG